MKWINEYIIFCCRKNLLATGDGVGCIKIFKLSDELVSQGPRELETLSSLTSVTSEQD